MRDRGHLRILGVPPFFLRSQGAAEGRNKRLCRPAYAAVTARSGQNGRTRSYRLLNYRFVPEL